MQAFIKYFKLFLFLISCTISFAQSSDRTTFELQQQFKNYTVNTVSVSAEKFFDAMHSEMRLSVGTIMKEVDRYSINSNVVYHKYQQYFHDLPVIGNQYLLKEVNDVVALGSGLYTPAIDLNINPEFSPVSISGSAKQYLANKWLRENNKNLNNPPFSQSIDLRTSEPKLCVIDQAFPNSSTNMVLAYQIEVEIIGKAVKEEVYINAQDGTVVFSTSKIKFGDVKGIGKSFYYGDVTIHSDSISPEKFLLIDKSRGGGIEIVDNKHNVFENNSKDWDITNQDRDEVAIDAMFGTALFYDMIKAEFNWLGLKNDTISKIGVSIHNNGAGNVNAFWDGERINFSDGDCFYGPMTTMEVVGHELTHGIIENTSNLIYFGESGAINESLADMLGKYLEYYHDPTSLRWTIGESYWLHPNLEIFRNMADPKSLSMPAYYNGEFWSYDNNLHINNSIGNLWFYRISEGYQGINEIGDSINITSIGISNAVKIAFLANRLFNTPTTNYSEFSTYTLRIAQDLYGFNSEIYLQVNNAWKSVGVVKDSLLKYDLEIKIKKYEDYQCGIGNKVVAKYYIRNNGSAPYDPFISTAFLYMNLQGNVRAIPISDIIYPQQSLYYEQELNSLTTFDFLPISLYISYDIDENLANNNQSINITTYEYEKNDMILFSDYNKNQCGDLKDILAIIFSRSCQILPKDTEYQLEWRDVVSGALLGSKSNKTKKDILGINGIVDTIAIDNNLIPSQIELRLNYSPDPDITNNLSELFIDNFKTIDKNYYEKFEAASLQFTNFNQEGFYDAKFYQDNNGYQFAGPLEYFHSKNLPDCFGPKQILDLYTQSSMSSCIDLRNHKNIEINFDLTMYNDPKYKDQGFLYSSLMEMTLDGSDPQYFYGLPQGQKYNINISLSDHYLGTIKFRFFGITKSELTTPASLRNKDVILIDNFEIKSNLTQKNNLEAITYSVKPNPATTNIEIVGDISKIKNISFFDLLGHQTKLNIKYLDQINISDLNSGVYFIQIETINGNYKTEKFIKL